MLTTGFVKSFLIRLMQPALCRSANATDVLLGQAAKLYLGKSDAYQLDKELNRYYQNIEIPRLLQEIQFDAVYPLLKKDGYKTDILDMPTRSPSLWFRPFSLWNRRLYLLRHARIRIDILLLKKGDSIPAHAHRGVLSGFLVLKGLVNIRHYDVSEYQQDGVICHKTVDKDLGAGGYTTNHDEKDNIHFLTGLADESVLYRFNITGLQSPVPVHTALRGRMYVDVSRIDTDGGFAPFK
ncbi:MAG TPA: hypothetical protein VIN66_16410 [Rheinheimera sp.]|uniref:hypothetical protein n=1 Tax=Rheinheimera sp. TaxID=1869214 RepID=UPI002F93CF29